MKAIQIDRDIFNFLLSKSESPEDTVAAVLRRELKVPQPQMTLEVDDQTYAFIAARTLVVGESTSDILRRELRLSSTALPAPTSPPSPSPQPVPDVTPATVVFHIASGTGSLPWNTRETVVSATVGDILRVINDDEVSHRLHTSGRPFPHPASDIPPNQTADFLLQTTFSPEVDGPLADHDQGDQARFWIRVVP